MERSRFDRDARTRDVLLEAIDRVQARNLGVPPEVIEAEVAAAIEEVRAEARARGRDKDDAQA